MEGTDLSCPKCGTIWKLIKAGDGPITCPNCKAVVGSAPTAPPPTSPTPRPVAADPIVPASARPAADDEDDPGIGGRPLGRMPEQAPPRRGRHPLVTVAIILLLLFLVPIALCSVLFAVCSVAFR